MKQILSRSHRRALERIAATKVLLAFDYDGTLAPMVPDPERASMRRRTSLLVKVLTKLYPVVVISGRSYADAFARVRDAGIDEVIGNHGIEPWGGSDEIITRVQTWLPILERGLACHPGVEIEDKRCSIAIHYRRARGRQRARRAILDLAARLDGVRAVGGKMVINLVPRGAPHKGAALIAARDWSSCDTAIYVGDDETDEDVFAIPDPTRILGIRVGATRRSAAVYCIPGQWAIDDLLRTLIHFRRGASDRLVDPRTT